jgi:hypothetical protein
LFHTYSGHFEEVTGLLLVDCTVVSVSIDATIRKWSLDPKDLLQAKTESEQPSEDCLRDPPKEFILTEEEESELAELMQDE